MPLCYCFATETLQIPEGFETRLSKHVAEVLTKPIERIAVLVSRARICKAGSTDAAFIMQIHSIGVFDKERNPAYFDQLFPFLKEELGLEGKRLQIQFMDIEGHMAKSGQ